jgi:hypothetical protein
LLEVQQSLVERTTRSMATRSLVALAIVDSENETDVGLIAQPKVWRGKEDVLYRHIARCSTRPPKAEIHESHVTQQSRYSATILYPQADICISRATLQSRGSKRMQGLKCR